MKRNRRQAGVTLIEMMVVVVIIALFAALVLPRMMGQADKARKTAARAQINAYLTALGSYKLDTGNYPTTEQGLQALVTQPESEPRPSRWHQSFNKVPTDPWGTPYQYRCPGIKHPDKYDLFSAGPDRQPDTADDDWGE